MIEASKDGGKTGVITYGMVGGGEGSFIGDVHRRKDPSPPPTIP